VLYKELIIWDRRLLHNNHASGITGISNLIRSNYPAIKEVLEIQPANRGVDRTEELNVSDNVLSQETNQKFKEPIGFIKRSYWIQT
jgi:hypothetical protein